MTAAIAEQEASRRIADLRLFEHEYRGRIREHLTSCLEELNERDPREQPRQEIISGEWSLIAPGVEIRSLGLHDRAYGRVAIEVREVPS